MARRGRKRKTGVVRYKSGDLKPDRSDLEQRLAYRKRELLIDDVKPDHAADQLSGYTLGRLRLRGRDGGPGISESQYQGGEEWARLVRRHAVIMGYSLGARSPSFELLSRGESFDATPEHEVIRIRRKWSDCYNALVSEGLVVMDICYAVCVEIVPVLSISEAQFAALQIGLTALAKVLGYDRVDRRQRI